MHHIKANDIIKHRRFLDVCVFVTDVKENESAMEIQGYWVNLGFTRSYVIQEAQITIDKNDLQNWLLCLNYENVNCLRYADWNALL